MLPQTSIKDSMSDLFVSLAGCEISKIFQHQIICQDLIKTVYSDRSYPGIQGSIYYARVLNF